MQVAPRPTQSRCDFLISTLTHFFKCVVLVDHIHWAVQWFGFTLRRWLPLLDSPWLSSSLTELWARRWHRISRDVSIGVGAKPLSLLFGRASWIIGGSSVSAILHYFGLWGLGRGTEFSGARRYFLIQGLGVLLEHILLTDRWEVSSVDSGHSPGL